jgi:glycerol-3-phosphate cytidylyltransferase
MIQLSAVKYVDEVVIYSTEQELLDLFRTLPIDVRIIGADYYDKDFTGKQYCLDAGIEIIYNSRNHSYSTTELRKRIAKADKEKTDPEGSV